mmetsp:Transcript_8853/g.14730  ORF Transcript_8853/g.14730 Transcript_8853/m.14730 type:complete len:286 (-) Transcript_8853:86-943(-)|eukprot:CAMPEP_0119012474 /NCGR_PEP_ID=MMETSP1176-20130426/6750_1 /TAXON_ID=265551 /ORGANISM="Synedropsis recta cf, Strain CCMP1620" /LENGTH=285 /DNA_ID=CAMNT_0006965439 /DNA_START=122 /DNA_END=979 /DNA_ORIENTATION=-
MPKYSDEWVVDKTLFEYVNGGSCGCCGRGFFLPDGVDGMIQAMSDLETDAANAEIKASAQSPWPVEMREQVWSDRVRLRHKMKKEMGTYEQFWVTDGDAFSEWCRTVEPKSIKKLLQIPRSEILERLNNHYGIHSAFAEVLKAVCEQVAKFKDTKYPTDARGASEIAFEQELYYDRRGGFTIKVMDEEGLLQEDVLAVWLSRLKSLGGPVLLERSPKKVDNGGGDSGGADETEDKNAPKPSFRSDRRIVRLLIARYWADALIKKYRASLVTEIPVEQSEPPALDK